MQGVQAQGCRSQGYREYRGVAGAERVQGSRGCRGHMAVGLMSAWGSESAGEQGS